MLLLIRVLSSVLFYGTPVLGFWLVSSLAAFLGGPPWMAWTAGAFLFPIIPGLWELHAHTHRRADSKPILKPLERLAIRTFIVGAAFIAVLLYLYPQAAFVALSTRGDWMLDGVKDARADKVRQVLFTAAGGIEWLHEATKHNPYKKLIDPEARQIAEEATKQREDETEKSEKSDENTEQTVDQDSLLFRPPPISQNNGTDVSQEDATDVAEQQTDTSDQQTAAVKQKTADANRKKSDKKWPWKQSALHPAVVSMPASVETSIESVAKYIAKQESDPVLRMKALHDYVADRVAYDSVSFYAGKFPPQDAETVFKTRKSVCAGYANLFYALATAIKEKVIVVVGNARDMSTGDRLSPSGHAWNAASIKGHWYLVDACWDSGYASREKGFTKSYNTNYLFPPPAVMLEDHFPEESTWQLLAKPMTQGEFLRQPMLRPSFQAAELVLLAPGRAQNEADSNAVAIVQNPEKVWLMASLEENGKQIGSPQTTNTETARIEFPLPEKGKYRLNMFTNEKSEYGDYEFVGSVDYVSR